MAAMELLTQPPGPRWKWNVPVPNDPNLVGIKVILQSVYAPLPLSLSNSLQLVVGR